MMYVADITMISVLRYQLENLRQDPDELAMLMSSYAEVCSLSHAVQYPAQYIDQAIKLLTDREKSLIEIFQGYSLTPNPNFSIYVYSSGQETNKFLGDYGAMATQLLTPTVYAKDRIANNITETDGHSILHFLGSDCLKQKIWRLQTCVNPQLPNNSWTVVNLLEKDEYFLVELNGVIPPMDNGTVPLSGWEFRSSATGYQVTYGTSSDDVEIRMFLRTTGDVELHRILATVVRYCLKKSRQLLETQGLQISTMGQSEPQPVMNTDQCYGFETIFTCKCLAHDRWVMRKRRLPEQVQLAAEVHQGSSVVILPE